MGVLRASCPASAIGGVDLFAQGLRGRKRIALHGDARCAAFSFLPHRRLGVPKGSALSACRSQEPKQVTEADLVERGITMALLVISVRAGIRRRSRLFQRHGHWMTSPSAVGKRPRPTPDDEQKNSVKRRRLPSSVSRYGAVWPL